MWCVALRVEVTYGVTYRNYVSFLFVIVTYFLFRHNYVIYLFGVVTFFDDVRITLYFGTFELRMEMTSKLRFVFVRHCDAFLLRYNYVIYLFDVVTFFDDVRNRFYFGTFELRMEKKTLHLRFAFVRHCNVFLLRHNYVVCLFDVITFFDDVRITLYFGMFESRTEITL